jgi:hypothetical protein
MLNSFAASALGTVYLDEPKVNKLFNVKGLKMDTSSLAPHLPLFQQKLGPNKSLKAVVSANHITVTFG